MSANVCILDWDQDTPNSLLQRGLTFIPKQAGEELLRRMVAERISAKVIRLFPPDSPFPQLKPIRRKLTNEELGILETGPELPGIVFREPISAKWRKDQESKSVCLRFLRNEASSHSLSL